MFDLGTWTSMVSTQMSNLAKRTPQEANHPQPVECGPPLLMVAECLPPLLYEIVGYAADKPQDLVSICMLSRGITHQLQLVVASLWCGVFERRWPAFHECLGYQGAQDWKILYRETLAGRCECTLEVFDREKKLGFAMAAMAARIQYEARLNAYVARYLSASEILPETIPAWEEHRLRFCPESAREQLRPGRPAVSGAPADGRGTNSSDDAKAAAPEYPFRVLTGLSDLKAGDAVELQWKMQYGSPFGWWYGTLEALHRDPDGKNASATITFQHFPSHSRWYRLEVRFGGSEMKPCSFGGYTGGIRKVTEAEKKHWMRFFPKEPVVF